MNFCACQMQVYTFCWPHARSGDPGVHQKAGTGGQPPRSNICGADRPPSRWPNKWGRLNAPCFSRPNPQSPGSAGGYLPHPIDSCRTGAPGYGHAMKSQHLGTNSSPNSRHQALTIPSTTIRPARPSASASSRRVSPRWPTRRRSSCTSLASSSSIAIRAQTASML
jgi:hypothetical protein